MAANFQKQPMPAGPKGPREIKARKKKLGVSASKG